MSNGCSEWLQPPADALAIAQLHAALHRRPPIDGGRICACTGLMRGMHNAVTRRA